MSRPSRYSGVPWIGEVPQDWAVEPFRRLFRESKEVNGPEPIGPMLSISGYRGVEEKIYESQSQVRDNDQLEEYRVVRPGQLAVNTMWLNHSGLGVSDLLGHMSPAYRAYWISSRLDGRYAHHLMRSSVYVEGYTALLTGIRPNSLQMSRADLMAFPVLVPPLHEQKAIADYLDRETAQIDAFIAKNEELIALLTERRAAVVARLVSRGVDENATLTDSGLGWAGEVPATWQVGNIRRFATMKTGHTPSRQIPEYWIDCDIPWFTLADVWQLRQGRREMSETTEKISQLGLANSAAELLPAGTVALSRTASVGFAGIMPVAMATSQDFWNWVPGENLVPEYLWYQFQAMKAEFERLMTGSTHRTIYQADAASFTILVPPIDEQRTIVARLEKATRTIDSAYDVARRGVALARERRAALISAAVTGKIDVEVAA